MDLELCIVFKCLDCERYNKWLATRPEALDSRRAERRVEFESLSDAMIHLKRYKGREPDKDYEDFRLYADQDEDGDRVGYMTKKYHDVVAIFKQT